MDLSGSLRTAPNSTKCVFEADVYFILPMALSFRLRDASWCGRDLRHELLLAIEHGYLAISIDIDDDGVALLDVLGQHSFCHAVFQEPHDGASQRPCTVAWVISLLYQTVLKIARVSGSMNVKGLHETHCSPCFTIIPSCIIHIRCRDPESPFEEPGVATKLVR